MKIFPRKRKLHLATRCLSLLAEFFSLERAVTSVANGGNYDFPAVRFDYTREFEDDVHSRRVQLYLFDAVTNEKLVEILESLSHKYNFNPRAMFVISGMFFTRRLRKTLRKLFVLDVIFFHAKTGYIQRFQPSTLTLSKAINCNENLTSLGEVVENTWKKRPLNLLYLNSHIYANCYPCENAGIEIETIKVILDHFKLNATFHRAETNNKNYKEMWKNHDVYFGTLVIAFVQAELEITMPYIYDEAAFFAPVSFDIPRWKYILTAFPLEVWIAWFSLSIIASIMWISTAVIDGKYEVFAIMLSTFMFFVEQAIRVRPDLISRRILMVGIVLLSFNMNLFFKGRFTYLLNGLNHVKHVENLGEIMENGFYIGVSTPYIADYINSSPDVGAYIQRHLVDCNQEKLEGCIERALNKRDIVFLYPVKKIRSRKKLFLDPQTGHPLLEQIKPSVAQMPIVLAFPKGHPSLIFFNEKLALLRESGIIDMISRKYEEELEEHEDTFYTKAKALNFGHVVGPLFILIIGTISSLFVFLNEIYEFVRFQN